MVSPESYDAVLDELREADRRLSPATREFLAAEAFAYTARYDTAIARWFQEKREDFPPLMVRAFERVLELPYGENPHQRAAYYAQVGARTHVLSMVAQLGGKPLSFNNLLDLDAGRLLLGEFQIPACVIIKHNNPCGVAVGSTALEAYQRAFACDPMSAFGGVIVPEPPRRPRARRGAGRASSSRCCSPAATTMTRSRCCRRSRTCGSSTTASAAPPNMIEPHLRQVVGGMLVQDRDIDLEERGEMQVVTERRPTEAEWRSCCSPGGSASTCAPTRSCSRASWPTVGIGAGQMSRVDSVRLAIEKARDERRAARRWPPTPTSRSPTAPSSALDAGVTAIIQPGGSVRDPDVVEAVDAAGATMVFTGRRHFRH